MDHLLEAQQIPTRIDKGLSYYMHHGTITNSKTKILKTARRKRRSFVKERHK